MRQRSFLAPLILLHGPDGTNACTIPSRAGTRILIVNGQPGQ